MREIYDKLRSAGLSHAGACGLIGNLIAESDLVPNIAQRGMTALSDEAYTTKFDKYPDVCIRDGDGLTLGNTTMEFFLVPGHTDGCIACFAHANGSSNAPSSSATG